MPKKPLTEESIKQSNPHKPDAQLSKKNKELKILKMIYPLDHFKEVTSTEDFGLDFLLARTNNTTVGVQITKLYSSESAARLKKPDYIGKTLSTNKFLHKDDKINIKLDYIKICQPDGHSVQTLAVIEELPSYKETISSIIKKKQSKLKTLHHASLIIYDKQSSLTSVQDFYKNFFYLKTIKMDLKSKFHEIYLITKIENKKIFIPLILTAILKEIHFFNDALIDVKYTYEKFSELIKLIYSHLLNSGLYQVCYSQGTNAFNILLEDFDIKINYIDGHGHVAIDRHFGYSRDNGERIFQSQAITIPEQINRALNVSRSKKVF